MRLYLAFIAFAGLQSLCAFSQSVFVQNGNIVFADQHGEKRWITTTQLDSEPSLSFDGHEVVFVRRTTSDTAEPPVDMVHQNELWIALVDRTTKPRRILTGSPAGFAPRSLLAGFHTPQFSPDGRSIYFLGDAWATQGAIHRLDLRTGKTPFLFPGVGVEVLRTGEYKGFLIGEKAPVTLNRGRMVVYWLLDPNGRDIRRIGETEAAVTRFQEIHRSTLTQRGSASLPG